MSKKNGKLLEECVENLEKFITSNIDGKKTIKRNKIINKDGTRHEIDLYVHLDHGKYESIYIFECKNWKNKVGKNEIIIFTEKIKAIQAQTGYFIASDYTKDAINQAKKDPRIKLLNVKESLDFEEIFGISLPKLKFTKIKHIEIQANMDKLTYSSLVESGHPASIDSLHTSLIYRGEIYSCQDFFRKIVHNIINSTINKFEPLKDIGDEPYEFVMDKPEHLTIKKGDLKINDRNIDSIDINLKFNTYLLSPKIDSLYKIFTRGSIGKLTLDDPEEDKPILKITLSQEES